MDETVCVCVRACVCCWTSSIWCLFRLWPTISPPSRQIPLFVCFLPSLRGLLSMGAASWSLWRGSAASVTPSVPNAGQPAIFICATEPSSVKLELHWTIMNCLVFNKQIRAVLHNNTILSSIKQGYVWFCCFKWIITPLILFRHLEHLLQTFFHSWQSWSFSHIAGKILVKQTISGFSV